MIDWFVAEGSAPFTVALLVMLGIAVTELLALLTGFSLGDAIDEFVVSHAELEPMGNASTTGMEATGAEVQGVLGRLLAWLHVGKVPVLMLLVVLLTVFGLAGLTVQGVLRGTLGFALPAAVAAPLVFIGSLPVLRVCARVLARLMPRDESSAVDPVEFVGRTALVVAGTARVGLPAQARLVDRHGTDHYVLVEPDEPDRAFSQGETVLLVRQTGGGRFAVIANPNSALIDPES